MRILITPDNGTYRITIEDVDGSPYSLKSSTHTGLSITEARCRANELRGPLVAEVIECAEPLTPPLTLTLTPELATRYIEQRDKIRALLPTMSDAEFMQCVVMGGLIHNLSPLGVVSNWREQSKSTAVRAQPNESERKVYDDNCGLHPCYDK
jgi:hypothetical protein